MEDRIEIGEYVRLARNQGINKIIDKKGERYFLEVNIANKYGYITNFLYEFELKKEIIKHNKQLIDLIENGDFVNGHKVKAIYLDGATKYIKLDNAYKNGQGTRTYEENIETILTKESYMANCYKVGGENG